MIIKIDTKENSQPFLVECIKNSLAHSITGAEKFEVTESKSDEKNEIKKELEFERKVYKPECWKTRTCAICGNKADFGCEIYLNMHCRVCYKNFHSKISKFKNYRALYKLLLNQ